MWATRYRSQQAGTVRSMSRLALTRAARLILPPKNGVTATTDAHSRRYRPVVTDAPETDSRSIGPIGNLTFCVAESASNAAKCV